MPLSPNALYLLQQRYCKNGETPENVFKRTAEFLAKGDVRFEEKLFNAMINGVFLPNSPALFNSGYKKASCHACYILPVQDSLESIFNSVTNMAKIFQSGGGVGINFSKLREKDAPLSKGGKSSGAISFMGVFDNIVEVVKQGGMRRGALMGILNYSHPEIFDFIKVKLEGRLQNFNLSIMVDDDFMSKVENGGGIEIKSPLGYNTMSIKAKDIFELMAFASWVNGDPALLFFDRINKDNPFYPDIIIDTCNPCSEVSMPYYSACCLGSINLSKFVWKNNFNFDRFYESCVLGIRTLTNMNEISYFPMKEIKEAMEKYFPVGLGVMGFADCFTGDTKIPLLNGTEEKIQNLVDKEFYVYSYDRENRKIVPGKATAKKFRNVNKILKITLDNGKEIRCTLDHKFLLRNNSYKEARFLNVGESLMPLYRKYTNLKGEEDLGGYEQILQPTTSPLGHVGGARDLWVYTHRRAIEDKSFKNGVVHHKDFNKKNNDPNNLVWMTKENHIELHSRLTHWTSENNPSHKPEIKILRSLQSKENWKNPDYRKKIIQEMSKSRTGKKYPKLSEAKKEYFKTHSGPHEGKFHSEETKSLMSEKRKQWYLTHNNPSFREDITNDKVHNLRDKLGLTWEEIGKELDCSYPSLKRRYIENSPRNVSGRRNPNFKHGEYCKKAMINHTIVSIETIEGEFETYCLIVDDYHNFALSAGVFVHNCLIKLGIYYDSQECLDFIDKIGTVYKEATTSYSPEKFYFYRRIIAPTGSLSILADCSSGIEPVYDVAFERSLTIGKIEETRELYKSEYVRTAHQISPEWHLKVLAKWQEWIDGGASKTVNLPYTASVDDIKTIYLNAWKMGVKGVTVYRDGSRNQVLTGVSKTNKFVAPPSSGKCNDQECTL